MLFLFPAILVLMIELIHTQSIGTAFGWCFSHFDLFSITYIFYGLLLLFWYAMIGSMPIATLVTSFLGITISIISYLKTMIRGDVLVYSDISLINTGEEIFSFVKASMFMNPAMITSFIFILVSTLCFIAMRKLAHMKLFKRMILLLISVSSFAFIFFSSTSFNNILPHFGISNTFTFSANDDYAQKGVTMGLYYNYLTYEVAEPFNYQLKSVSRIIENLPNNPTKEIKQEELPNVVVIMSESFMDITKLPQVTFSKDPIPTFHELQKNNLSGTLISSTYGGGTSNIEFEVFTGNTIAFMPYGQTIFTGAKDIFQRDIPTILKDFKKAGYTVSSIHPYLETFYDRNNIYPTLGFDKSYFIEDLQDVRRDGIYVSDEYLTDKVLEILNASDGPNFVYALSMQNHLPYNGTKYNHPSPSTISSNVLSKDSYAGLDAYVHGVADADAALGKLIKAVQKNTKRPTVILFYGDHFPSLNQVFYETGYVSTTNTAEWNVEELFRMHQIPFVLYDTRSVKPQNVGMLGAPFLGNLLLNYVGIEKSINFDFLDTITFTSIRSRLFVDGAENPHSIPTVQYQRDLGQYETLQYDILFGKEYYKKVKKQGEIDDSQTENELH